MSLNLPALFLSMIQDMGSFFQDIRYFFPSWPKSGGQGIKTNCYFNSDLNMKLCHTQLVCIVQMDFSLPNSTSRLSNSFSKDCE